MNTAHANGLAQTLIDTWARQGRDGFLLSDPATTHIGTRVACDDRSGVEFRFRWIPHREYRGDVAELERRGILNPQRDEESLFRDPRDPQGRHCFLCLRNIRACHPKEILVPMKLAGRDYHAGANFAWIQRDHFTVMPVEHVDQAYSRHALDAMLDLFHQAGGRFRVLFNGPGAGASIPWHLHYQITTSDLPIEGLAPARRGAYPTAVERFLLGTDGADAAHAAARAWIDRDRAQHTVNVMIAPRDGDAAIFIFPRDRRKAKAEGKGLVGGFEVAGEFVMSSPAEQAAFQAADAELARAILSQVNPAGSAAGRPAR